jgi:tellurite resistance protein TehA-like permease
MRLHLAPAPLDLARLSPASFAFVMATGIVGVAALQQHLLTLAWGLFALNLMAWLVLATLYVLRLVLHPRDVLRDVQDHARGPGFFTAIAGTAVLAGEMVLFEEPFGVAVALAALAAVLWLVLTYAVFAALTIKAEKPPLERGLNGSWLLAVVALQSLAVVGGLLSAQVPQPWRLQLNFAVVALWLGAGMLYTWLMALIFYRFTFLRFTPQDLGPPSWINMGAMAISALAGTQLVANAPQAPFLEAMLPFLKGFTLLYWATGTWWIPLLAVLAAWRFASSPDSLRWDPLAWATVFPLGMYSAATHRIGEVLALPFLEAPSRAFLALALAAWALAVLRLLRHWAGRGTLPG